MISYLLAGNCAGQDFQEEQNTDADAQARLQGRVVPVAAEADDDDTAALLHLAGEKHAINSILSLPERLHYCF